MRTLLFLSNRLFWAGMSGAMAFCAQAAPPGGASAYETPAAKRTVQASYRQQTPAIDGNIDKRQAPPWVPIVSCDWKRGQASVAAWFSLEWNEQGLCLAVLLPNASAKKTIPAGRETPEAPFILVLSLDAQSKPDPDALGRYRLRFLPVAKRFVPLDFTSLMFLRNRRLGAGSRLDEPGLVIFGEETHCGFSLENVQARWAAPPEGGLALEAFVPWGNLRVEGLPRKTPVYFNLEVIQPGIPRAGWLAGIRTEREGGGRIQLLGPGEAPAPDIYFTQSLTPLVSTELNLQEHPVQAVFPAVAPDGKNSPLSVSFSLVAPDGKTVALYEGKADLKRRVARAELKTSNLPDGLYRIRVLLNGEASFAVERPIRLAGQEVANRLRPTRAALEKRLAQLNAAAGPVWREGHLERAKACIAASLLPKGAQLDRLPVAFERLDDARAITEALEAGRRPDPAFESVLNETGIAADGQSGPVEIVPVRAEAPARLTVRAAEEAPWKVSPFVYGTFSEPLFHGRPIYGRLCAQRLFNPSFEWGCQPSAAMVRRFAEELDLTAVTAISEGKWLPTLKTPPNAVASPWFAVGEGDARFMTTGGACNTSQCQRIEAETGQRGAGVAQILALPAWRCSRYKLRCFLRSDAAPAEVRAALYHDGRSTGRARLGPIGKEWRAFEVELEAPIVEEKRNTFLFALTFDGPGALVIDQVTLSPSDAIDGLDPQAVQQVRDMKTQWIRWPGGNYTSGYNWRDGIGPLDKRPTRVNPAWPGLDPNLMGTDEFLRFCELTGVEPLICVNAGLGKPEEAADWVEYCNGAPDTPMGRLRAANGHPKPYSVRHWNVGNELWGRFQLGYCEAKEHAARYETFAKAMLARDPSIRLMACGLGPFQDENARRWNEALMDRSGKDLEMIDFHTYIGIPPIKEPDYVPALEALAAMPVVYERALYDFGRDCRARGLDDLRVVVGEYAISKIEGMPVRLMQTGNFLGYAGWLHAFLRQGDLVVGANATEFSIFDPRAGQFGQLHPRCALYQLYAREAGSIPLRARLETPVRQSAHRVGPQVPPVFNLPLIDAVALKDPADGALGIGLLNRDLRREIGIDISLEGFTPRAEATRYLYQDRVDIDKPERTPERPRIKESRISVGPGVSVKLPPCSVTLLKLQPRG